MNGRTWLYRATASQWSDSSGNGNKQCLCYSLFLRSTHEEWSLVNAHGLRRITLLKTLYPLRREDWTKWEQSLPQANSKSHINPSEPLDAYLPLNQNGHSLTEVCPVLCLLNADYSRRVEARGPSGTLGKTWPPLSYKKSRVEMCTGPEMPTREGKGS